jgi:lysozyme
VNAPRLLLFTSAAALLLVADFTRRQLAPGDYGDAPDWSDHARALASEAMKAVTRNASAMQPSQALRSMLKRRERFSATPYDLGDGGLTIGYGRFYKHGGPLPPARIDLSTAELWFEEDIDARAARWVRAYVSVPLTQHQFDALVHMAYNLKPSSFKTIAEAVNRGEDPEAQALRYVRAGTNLERGLRIRRAEEMNLYRNGVYS